MQRKLFLILGTALVTALAFVAAGCGGGGSKSAATTEAATTEAATTEAATTEATTTEATTTEATTTEATTTTGLPSFAAGKCRDLANLGQKYAAAFSGSGSGADLKKTDQLLHEVADKAPSDIKADFQVLADYFSKIVAAVGNYKPGQTPSPEALAKLQKLSTEIDQAKLTAASQHITTWVQKNCHA